MTPKTKIIICTVALLTAFAIGRYTVPVKIVTEVKTVEVEKKTDNTKVDANEHKKVVIVQRPDGTKETTITDEKDTKTNNQETDNVAATTDSTRTEVRVGSQVNLSFLAGAPLSFTGLGTPVYGASATKSILGPITVGVWGLSNATGGLSVGLNF